MLQWNWGDLLQDIATVLTIAVCIMTLHQWFMSKFQQRGMYHRWKLRRKEKQNNHD